MEKEPEKLFVILDEKIPVGLVLYGKSEVAEHEPELFPNYTAVYRMFGFFIDQTFQKQGFGKQALRKVLEEIQAENLARLPITLEVKGQNTVAQAFYQEAGFQDTGVRYNDDLVYVRFSK